MRRIREISDSYSKQMLVDYVTDPDRSMRRLMELATKTGRLHVSPDVYRWMLSIADPCAHRDLAKFPAWCGIQIVVDDRMAFATVAAIDNRGDEEAWSFAGLREKSLKL